MKTEDFSSLIGKTIKNLTVSDNKEQVNFETTDNIKYLLYHNQDCCESVYIEDICGDVNDLINSPILLAEEETQCGVEEYDQTSTWTFYKLSTIKGSVTIRWYGESNGYYSENVDLVSLNGEEKW